MCVCAVYTRIKYAAAVMFRLCIFIYIHTMKARCGLDNRYARKYVRRIVYNILYDIQNARLSSVTIIAV